MDLEKSGIPFVFEKEDLINCVFLDRKTIEEIDRSDNKKSEKKQLEKPKKQSKSKNTEVSLEHIRAKFQRGAEIGLYTCYSAAPTNIFSVLRETFGANPAGIKEALWYEPVKYNGSQVYSLKVGPVGGTLVDNFHDIKLETNLGG
mgnify:FL=1